MPIIYSALVVCPFTDIGQEVLVIGCDLTLKSDDFLRKAHGMAKALALLPADDFEAEVEVIEETVAEVEYARFANFVRYLRRTWLPSEYSLEEYNYGPNE